MVTRDKFFRILPRKLSGLGTKVWRKLKAPLLVGGLLYTLLLFNPFLIKKKIVRKLLCEILNDPCFMGTPRTLPTS